MSSLPALPDGWMWAEDESALLCPCPEDYAIELDGECPNGHVSPFR